MKQIVKLAHVAPVESRDLCSAVTASVQCLEEEVAGIKREAQRRVADADALVSRVRNTSTRMKFLGK